MVGNLEDRFSRDADQSTSSHVISYTFLMPWHLENTFMQYTKMFCFRYTNMCIVILLFFVLTFFLYIAQNINGGYTLEPPWRGGSNENPQSMFWNKDKKNRKPFHTPFLLYKSGK